jgi:hypothetical protein
VRHVLPRRASSCSKFVTERTERFARDESYQQRSEWWGEALPATRVSVIAV